MSLKNQFKYYRKQNNLKQDEVAHKIGVTRQCYAHYEQGIREPSIETLRRLCVLFNISADELLEIETKEDRKKVVINHSFNNSKNINFKI